MTDVIVNAPDDVCVEREGGSKGADGLFQGEEAVLLPDDT
jgi:hypothetical protein